MLRRPLKAEGVRSVQKHREGLCEFAFREKLRPANYGLPDVFVRTAYSKCSHANSRAAARRADRVQRTPCRRCLLLTWATLSSDALDDFELSSPDAPSLDPRLGVANREHHQQFIDQALPITIGTRPVPAAKDCVNLSLQVDGILLKPDLLIPIDITLPLKLLL